MEMQELKILKLLETKTDRENCLESLKYFVKHFWKDIVPNDLIWSNHLDVLCEEIQRADERVFQRVAKEYDLIINVPPGTSKTLICSVFSTAWEFARMPDIKVFVGSYSDSAVLNIADNISILVNSEKYKSLFPDVQIRKNANTKHGFKTTVNGEFYAYTVGGTITGKHADILKLDDPINPKQVASKVELKKTNDFIDRTLPTRKTDKLVTPTYLIMQRLSHDDPTAHLLEKKGEGIRHICLPAKLNSAVYPKEMESIYTDGILDPYRLSQEALTDLRADLGEWGFNSQILQQPTPPGGNIFKRDWFEISDFDPKNFRRGINLYIDPAYTEKETNDPTAIAVYFKHVGAIFLVDCFNVRLNFPDLEAKIYDTLIQYGHPTMSTVWIEAKGPGISLVQSLQHSRKYPQMRIKGDNGVPRSKEARASATSRFVEDKSFKIIEGDWNEEYLAQMCDFPYAKHDDMVDCTTAIIRLELYRGEGAYMTAR